MAVFWVIGAALALCAQAQAAVVSRAGDSTVLSLEPLLEGGFHLVITRAGEEKEILGHIGKNLDSNYVLDESDLGVSVLVSNVNLTVEPLSDELTSGHGVRISWKAGTGYTLEDCIDFGTKHWYGGPMQMTQSYPLETAEHPYASYVTKERDNGAISERYWLNSAGEYYYVHPEVPLFVDYNNITSNHICFIAEISDPYSSGRNHTDLTYDIWFLSNAKEAHSHAVANYLGKPSDVVDYRMIERPIWSTWAQFSRDIDEDNIITFAQDISDHGFENAQFEIDDLWEICYGSLTVDVNKFSNFSRTVQDLKLMGYRVSIWIHPFINQNCEPWYTNALNSGYLVLNEDGSPVTSWWNNNGTVAAYVDFTNPAAAEWWTNRVKYIVDTYNIDSLKFDAGESSWSPQVPVQQGDIDMHPHHIVQTYVKICATFGSMVEVRTGFLTQNLPIFVRMVDRDSAWGLTNGLSTIITTTLQMNLAGYTLVLPDMIGGNGFNLNNSNSGLPTKELFIRWVQANTFLPAMQYSFVPWDFDNETVEISKKYTELHAQYADHIYRAMNASVHKGTPVNAPLWWLDPTDETAQVIWDEYLLGEDIIAAPILTPNQTVRDIYLPVGKWLAEGKPDVVHTGPGWIRNYSAPLDTLPYFVRYTDPGSAVRSYYSVTLVLVLIIAVLL